MGNCAFLLLTAIIPVAALDVDSAGLLAVPPYRSIKLSCDLIHGLAEIKLAANDTGRGYVQILLARRTGPSRVYTYRICCAYLTYAVHWLTRGRPHPSSRSHGGFSVSIASLTKRITT
ncbi:hypothetical protein BDZ89DRAFT_621431 [Hymenopellis radicata]|nr:hypothetical protein BDZ89DRAFT_621431 [Hymenopellis radicata]